MSDDEFQIVAFSTNETTPTANDILKIFLDQHSHTIQTQSLHAISCEFSLPNIPTPKKLMMCLLSDINRTYEGINDVSFYFLFVHLENSNVQKDLELVCSYMKNYCDRSKKIFVFGILKDELCLRKISDENVKEILGEKFVNYKYYEINLIDKAGIGDLFLNIFLSFSPKRENTTNIQKNEVGQHAHSCVFF